MMKSTPVMFSRARMLLHVVGWKLHHRHRGLGRVARRESLHRGREDVAGLPRRVAASLVLELPHGARDVVPGIGLELVHERLLRLPARKAGDSLQRADMVFARPLELLRAPVEAQLALVERALARVDLAQPPLQRFLAVEDPLLEAADLGAPLSQLLLEPLPQAHELLGGVAHARLGGGPRLLPRRGLSVCPAVAFLSFATRTGRARALHESFLGRLQHPLSPSHSPCDGGGHRSGGPRNQDLHVDFSPGRLPAARSIQAAPIPAPQFSFV
jgi:hypothetical protein